MKLYKIENEELGIWYFTSKAKIAKFIDTSLNYIALRIGLEKPCKGWMIEEIDSDDVLSKYINPKRKDVFGDVEE